MSRFVKLPENLKSWKINGCISDVKGNEVYKITKKDYDGTIVTAQLRRISIVGDAYNSDNVDYMNDEYSFIKNIIQSGTCFNYVDIALNNNPAKEKIELFIVTEDLTTLKETLKTKKFDDAEIVDFGIQMSATLEKLEANNIFHGNINPENIYVTKEGTYKLGGFSDFESRIDDMSFVAPEIYKKENADFTTDIYSLGLIMYYMCNNSLPFESESTNKDEAIKARFEGKSIIAPKDINEKLKSVIVIACQPNNTNRWKNASNIKNALTSIKSELPATTNKNVIAPESTEFEGNVFEEFDYEEFDESPAPTEEVVTPVVEAPVIVPVVENVTDTVEVEAPTQETTVEETDSDFEEVSPTVEETENVEVVDNTTAEAPKNDTVEIEEEIDNRVFDSYQPEPKVIDFKKQAKEKDYGDYFEDEETPEVTEENKEPVTIKTEPKVTNLEVKDNYDYDVFGEDDIDSIEDVPKSKKNTVAIVLSVLAMIVALGVIAFFIIHGISSNSNKKEEETTTQSTTVASDEETTTEDVQQTTVAETTVAETTINTAEKSVIPVVGYGYSYAKKLLEKDGFVVEIGEYKYSTEYDAGYVIKQSPEGNATAKGGSVVVLDISSGRIEEEATEAPTEATPQNYESNSNDEEYLFANSNSAYLSKSDIASLSRTDLNLALNEIYARRGRIFKDASLSSYFNSKSWYTPKYNSSEFEKNVTFNKYEQSNLQLMINMQKEKGYR